MHKPLISIKQKCRECDFPNMQVGICKSCKGTGTQETEIYALRDFECTGQCMINKEEHQNCINTGGYIIPFKDYEILNGVQSPLWEVKKVSEMSKEIYDYISNRFGNGGMTEKEIFSLFLNKNKFKEDDKVVIRK